MCQGEGTGLSEACEQAVRAELSRLLDGPSFRTSKRCRDFVAYIVEHTITGEADALKERSIGVKLFQLRPDFDSSQHTIVRVTASEVRKKIAQYYLAENPSHHQVRIELHPGSYTADFKWPDTPVGGVEQSSDLPRVKASEPVAVSFETPPPVPAVPSLPVVKPTFWLKRGGIYCALAVLLLSAAFYVWRGLPARSDLVIAKTSAVPDPIATALSDDGAVRMIMGSAGRYIDRSGRIWGADRFFSGGSVLVRPAERIYRTLDPDIYRHVRQGDFRYDIPLKPGTYELHLHFAETGLGDFISAESSGEGQRIFRVYVNGNLVLDLFDVLADAVGSNISDERVFRDVSPAADGFLHLNFMSVRSTAILSGIEILPTSPGKVRPIRIRAGWTASWQDSLGRQWDADSYFLGGNALVRTANPVQESTSTKPDVPIYASERWGHFSYAVPVADGRYRVTLKFSEGHYGGHNSGVGGLGSRVFDVYCNGVALMRNLDIFKEAGGEGRPWDRTFTGISPNAQGKIILTFVPLKGMACVNGIEVTQESN